MKNADGRFGNAGKQISIFLFATLLVFHVTPVFSQDTLSEMTEGIRKCAAKKDKDEKLECYDNLSKRTEFVSADVRSETGSKEKHTPDHKITMMEKLWNLDEKSRDKFPMIQWYNPNYFLFVSYNTTPNRGTMLDADPNAKAQNTEAVFQLSGKFRVTPDDLSGLWPDVWIGYTQLSFWQLYNKAFSAPFRDTNYAPEGFLTFRTNYNFLNLNLRTINAGFVHQSNGRSRPLSRSWNRLFTEFGFEKVFNEDPKEDRNEFNLFVKAWYRLSENSLDDDNPDIEKYMGYGEIRGVYYWKNCRVGMMLRNNLRANNKGALQLDFSIPISIKPISDKISFYIQYFNGYGGSLLDYNSSSNRFSAGFMFTDWLK
jgi:phospholipase A1